MAYQRMEQIPQFTAEAYWLAEPQRGLLETLYENEPDPAPIKLFEGTAYAAQAAQSPILFKLSKNGLTRVLKKDPQRLQGLFVTTHKTRTELLTQLRSLLEARFQQHRKALLRYYDPRVASYLLPTCTGTLQERWLGPIEEMAWYGGTWSDEVDGAKQWHLLTHLEQAETKTSSGPLSLNDVQLQRLVEQGYEHFAWRWLAGRKSHGMTQIIDWIKRGMAAGYQEENSLNAWLDRQLMMQGEQHG